MSSDLEKKQSGGGDAVETASSESLPSYEEAAVTTGAPIEKISPLGYHVDWFTVIFLVRMSNHECSPSHLPFFRRTLVK